MNTNPINREEVSMMLRQFCLVILVGLALTWCWQPTSAWGLPLAKQPQHTTKQKQSKKKVAQAQQQIDQLVSNGAGPWWKRLSASVTLGTSLGTGSFAPAETYRNHFVAQSLLMMANYNIWNGVFVSGRWGFDIEYTQPDNASGRRFLPRDVALGVGWRNPIKPIRSIVNHMVRLNVQLPTSLLAQVSTRILQLDLGVVLTKNIKRVVTFGYAFGVVKGFHQYTSPIFNQSNSTTPSLLLRQSTRDAFQLADGLAPLPSTRNISWQVRNTIFARVNFHKTLSLGLTFGIFNAFKYPMPDDDKTPTIPTVNGDIKADTVGRFDFTMGDISLVWQPLRHLQVALGAVSLQTPMTANNAGLRVPFLNLATPNDNTTTFYLNLTGMY